MSSPDVLPPLLWDVFCRVIDNHGDVGVCWRLSSQLAARGQRVRLWIDDAAALTWMAPQGAPGVQVRPWTDGPLPAADAPGDVWVEAFGCELPEAFVAARAARTAPDPVWINLEYLSAEAFVERAHRLPSPVMHGPGRGLVKTFFYPGFTARTGGLLREPDLMPRQAAFDAPGFRRRLELPDGPLASLFCYEPPGLASLVTSADHAEAHHPGSGTAWAITPGRAARALDALPHPPARTRALPWLTQTDFDHLLWACDVNFVRGEDSLVRALWAGKPFVWHIYPQHDDAHHAKLDAFLRWLDAPPDWRDLHRAWNGITAIPAVWPTPDRLSAWAEVAQAARQRLLAQPDLVSQLLGLVAEKR